ncbi:MAG: endonuclease/exonuclease/phosphatase family protein [Coleofasciculus sp. S288]|nr:endonuclease/exonuclease/phosphatase family protein [Coleofasciculus sp. S288]
MQGKAVQVIVMRPPAPQTKAHFNRRNQVLRTLADYAKQQKPPLILMGDFNTTSWSLYWREFVQRSGLRSASLGHGLHLTWYYAKPTKAFSSTHWLFQLIKIPIDHIFVSQNVHVDRVTTAPPGVSDHRPLIVNIRV